MDYLAEVTMSLLARARMKDPEAGYPPDFVGYLKRSLPEIARQGIKIASNGGGVNPAGCKRALEAVIAELGLSLRVAMVEGDDVMPLTDHLRAAGLKEAVSGEPLPARLLTANAYLGALPIKAAFEQGADIVITGRCADSALALGILMHEFGWAADDYDRLGAGSLVGHILECGPQATGGNFTDWESVPGWHNIGYPIAECRADGSFTVTKPDGTGGMITPAVIAEQTLYEIADPAAYFLPDVVADFSHVRLTQVGTDRVHVEGAKGRPPTSQYKVSATYQDGYRAVATISIVGIDAARKAEKTAEALIGRARMLFAQRKLPDFTSTHVETLGAEASYGPNAPGRTSREVLLRVAVAHPAAMPWKFSPAKWARSPSVAPPAPPASTPAARNPPRSYTCSTFFLDKTSSDAQNSRSAPSRQLKSTSRSTAATSRRSRTAARNHPDAAGTDHQRAAADNWQPRYLVPYYTYLRLVAFFQCCLVEDHAFAVVKCDLEVLRQLQRIGRTSFGAQAAEHAAAQVVAPRNRLFALGCRVALALHYDQLLRAGQRAQVANDAHRFAALRIDLQAWQSAVALVHNRTVQRILLGDGFTGRLVVKRHPQAFDQIHQQQFAQQRLQTHLSTPTMADEICGNRPHRAVAISTPSPIGSKTFQPTFMS